MRTEEGVTEEGVTEYSLTEYDRGDRLFILLDAREGQAGGWEMGC